METKNIYSKIKKAIMWLLLAVLGVVISWYFGKKLEWWSKLDSFIAVVITNKSDATFTIPEEFRKGFGNDNDFRSAERQQLIRFKKEDDFLSEIQAKIIADKLISDKNCILIIGNSTSSLTEVTLNSILSSKFIKPGFILPIATADNIIDKAKDQNYEAILRMMPNNDKQANTITSFIFQKFPSKNVRVAILSDEDNPTYSHNLSQKIADKILLTKSEDKKGTIVLKKDYGNSNRFANDYELLKKFKLKPDIIVFVGISPNGNLLMEELRNLCISDIPVIYTDGCTVNNLMIKAVDNPNQYFISAVDINGGYTISPTYNPVGTDAKNLAKLIIDQINGNVTRTTVAEQIVKIKNDGKMIMDDGLAGKYQFNKDGDNIAMNWRVYSYVNKKLEMVYNGN